MLMLPEQGIAGFIYPSFHAGGPGKARAKLFGPGLEAPIKEDVDVDYPDTMDFDDLTLGPLYMAIREPHKQIDLAWNGGRLKFNGRYDALHPPYAFSLHPDGVPPYYGDDRTEQHGGWSRMSPSTAILFSMTGFLKRPYRCGPIGARHYTS